MKTTYRKIAQTQDIFRKLSEVPLPIADAATIKDGILELDKLYGELDIAKKELISKFTVDQPDGNNIFKEKIDEQLYNEQFNSFLDQEIELSSFPITVIHGSKLTITAMDLIRLGDLLLTSF